MLERHASPSRQEVIPAGRLNLDRGKAGPDHIDGAQKTIVKCSEQGRPSQANRGPKNLGRSHGSPLQCLEKVGPEGI